MLEQWLPIPGFEGFYEASTLGDIRTIPRRVRCKGGTRQLTSRLLKPSLDKDGYALVSLSRSDGTQKSFRWHRVILLTFRGECPPGKEGRHLDGDPSHNALPNLDWGTPRENWTDRKAHGRGVDGDRNPNSHAYRNAACSM